MKYCLHPFCKLIKYGLNTVLLAAFISPMAVIAQDEEGIILEEVIVTGSRIQRSDFSSISPISVFTETDILESGYVTMEGFVQSIPSVTGGFYGSSINNGNHGMATVSMRGLGSHRTLVLLNGRRMPSANTGGFVDLNMVPVSIVERIEVLRDGASTVYGSDAIAGVVNIITKKNFDGANFRFQYDVTDEDDGKIYQAAGLMGASSDRGNVVFGLEYTKREQIMQGDRKFSECPLREDEDGELFCGGSGNSYPGQFFVQNPDHPLSGEGGQILYNGDVVPFEAERDAFNFAKWSYMVTPQEVWSVYANSHFDLLQESRVSTMTAFMEAVWSNRQSSQLLAAVGTFWGPTVPASNTFNPMGEDVRVQRRLFETGGRHFTQDTSFSRIVTGLRGEFNNGWNWDLSYNLGRFVDTRIIEGQINQPRVDVVVDPALCAASIDGCPRVWDPFRVDTLDQALLDYILVDHSPVVRSEMQTWQANLSGDVGWFELPGGLIQWAVGVENRSDEILYLPDGAAALGQIYFVAPEGIDGGYEVDEIYGEMRLPVLQGVTMADILAAEVSVRRSDYSNLEKSTTNWKFALEWAPTSALRFRGVYSEGFRAASIGELFFPQQPAIRFYNDPCENYGTSGNAVVAANCASEGLPPDFQLGFDEGTFIFGGNPDLEPEESESITVGLVWAPESIPNLTGSIDFFNIQITSTIVEAAGSNIINGCYDEPNFSSAWCDLIPGPTHPLVGEAPLPGSNFRNSLGNLSGILATQVNLADYETQGIDFALNYSFEAGPGQLSLGVMGTYLDRYHFTPFAGADRIELAGFFGPDQFTGGVATFPTWKVNFNFQYYMGNWSFAWIPRWFDKTESQYADDANAENFAKAIWYHNVQATYDLNHWNFALGVRNLFDEDPPYVTDNGDMNTIHFSYDTAGRYFYGRVSYSF
jgi:iron complex outermembrane receptor protein